MVLFLSNLKFVIFAQKLKTMLEFVKSIYKTGIFWFLFSRSTVYNVGTLGTRLGSTLMSRGGVGGGGGGGSCVSPPARSPNGDFKNFDTTRWEFNMRTPDLWLSDKRDVRPRFCRCFLFLSDQRDVLPRFCRRFLFLSDQQDVRLRFFRRLYPTKHHWLHVPVSGQVRFLNGFQAGRNLILGGHTAKAEFIVWSRICPRIRIFQRHGFSIFISLIHEKKTSKSRNTFLLNSVIGSF